MLQRLKRRRSARDLPGGGGEGSSGGAIAHGRVLSSRTNIGSQEVIRTPGRRRYRVAGFFFVMRACNVPASRHEYVNE